MDLCQKTEGYLDISFSFKKYPFCPQTKKIRFCVCFLLVQDGDGWSLALAFPKRRQTAAFVASWQRAVATEPTAGSVVEHPLDAPSHVIVRPRSQTCRFCQPVALRTVPSDVSVCATALPLPLAVEDGQCD